MISVLQILHEIRTIANNNLIKLIDLEYNDEIDSKYPKIRQSYHHPYLIITDEAAFWWWKSDMISGYGPNLIISKTLNTDKQYFYHGKYKLEIPKINTVENNKYWAT